MSDLDNMTEEELKKALLASQKEATSLKGDIEIFLIAVEYLTETVDKLEFYIEEKGLDPLKRLK